MAERYPNHMFHRFLMAAMQFESPWRKKNQVSFEYYDDEQWTEGERRIIEERGQQATVINTIRPTIDMVCSVAAGRRADIQVAGREQGDDDKAVLLTELLRHVFDVCNFDYYYMDGFREACIGGRSWFECVKYTDEIGKDMLRIDKIPWENVYLDPFSRKPDASDARYIIKVKWIDRDVLTKIFPEAKELVENVFNAEYHNDYLGQEHEAQLNASDRGQGFYYDNKTQRVRVCECYYTVPETVKVRRFDEETGREKEVEIDQQTVHYVIFADDVILKGSATDHRANVNPLGVNLYPLIPMYCMRDRNGRPKGLVHSLIDIQEQINKLHSKFLWTLASNRLIVEEGAVRDVDKARSEYQRPDGVVVLTDGGMNKVRTDDKRMDLSFMSNHINFLLMTEQRLSGVNDSMLGIGGTNERSGTIQSARISQGAAMQTNVLENMFFSKQRIAYVMLRLIGRFYTDYRVIRVVGLNGVPEKYEFNKPVADGSGNNGILNRIDDTLYYDVWLKKVPPFDSTRERELTIFSEVLKTNAIPAPIAAKMMLELSDIPHKADFIFEIENFYKAQAEAAQASAAAPVQ